MRPLRLLSALALTAGLTSLATDAAAQAPLIGGRVYRGAWFELRHPVRFTPRPFACRTEDETDPRKCDGAVFSDRSGRVQFLVYAPPLPAHVPEVEVDTARERVIESDVRQEGQYTSYRYRVRAVDGSYERAVLDVHDSVAGKRRLLSFRYPDARGYRDNLVEYSFFRRSFLPYLE